MNNSSNPTSDLAEYRLAEIKTRLESALQPQEITVIDQSHLHAGHAGAKSGKGHFEVRLVSEQFNGCSLIQRHRLVYAALGDFMTSDIHALSIKALSPND